MPDFEALIRHQQLKQPKSNQRLKVVESLNSETKNNEYEEIEKPKKLLNFFGSFFGGLIGTLTILFLYINDFLPLDLLKVK